MPNWNPKCGESHGKAKFTNGEVELMRKLHEEDGMTIKELAEKFEATKGYISKVCQYKIRAYL